MAPERIVLSAAGAVLLLGCQTGCVVGPTSIAAGRSVYNEVINATEDEQLLGMIVKDRYHETYGMLAVGSVTANIRARANVQAQFGLSRSLRKDYSGNLVPLSSGVAYEENPTISYIPLGGERFVQRLLSPLTLEETLLMARYLRERKAAYAAVGYRSINGRRNPLTTRAGAASTEFERIVNTWDELKHTGALRFGREPDGEIVVMLRAESAEEQKLVDDLMELTGIDKQRSGDGTLIIPIRVTAYGWVENAFNFETRTVLEILRSAGECIEVPQDHIDADVVEPSDERLIGRFMRIRTSRLRPRGEGTVAIRYRNWWYYVDDSDIDSKQAFHFLRTLIGLRLYEHGKEQAAPVLTIPVG